MVAKRTPLSYLSEVISRHFWQRNRRSPMYFYLLKLIFVDFTMPFHCPPIGIASKVEYLKDLGVTGVWLSPFFKSPMVDNGYDVEDYKAVDPVFGTILDFKVILNSWNLPLETVTNFSGSSKKIEETRHQGHSGFCSKSFIRQTA